ncbi:MAG: hypothetical protein CBC00_06405 [Verrucomicrobia bacterium TMED40]|nr:MAG: hypothetical protein CBC00_06405 [Verrucomicrobia bacterium TMED40]
MNRFSRWLVVLVGVVLCLYPFLWMFLSSFKTNREIYQPTLLFPDSYDWGAYASLFGGEYLSFFTSFANSLALSCGQAFLATLVSVGAGFALAKFRLRWAGSAFFLAVLLVVLPKQTLAVSMFEWLSLFGWHGSLWSLILPGAVTGLGVIFFLQLFRNLPDEWLEIAKIEGLSPLRSFQLLLPLAFPGLVTFFLLHFVLSWQEHLLPLLVLNEESMTLPLTLAKLRDASHRIPESVSMAAATLSLLPVMVMFAVCFRLMRSALREVTHS